MKIGSVYSPSIYILHIFVGQYLLVSNLDDYPLFKTGIIFLESLLLSIFYIYLKKLIKSIYETNSNHYIQAEKSIKNGRVFGVLELPKNSLGAEVIYYDMNRNSSISLCSRDWSIDLAWSKLKKGEQKEIIDIIEKFIH